MDAIGIIVGVLLGALLAIPISLSVDSGWRQDCEKVGFHRSGDKVYECKVKP